MDMAKRITIKDISKQLNIHHSTVSRALRNHPKVKEETKKRIVDYAKKHGYKVNMSALQLRGSARNVIAVIVPNISHHFFSNAISVITNLAYKEGYIVSVFQTNESFEQEKQVLDSIIQNNIAGIIASVSMQTSDVSHFKELERYKIPLVLFDRLVDDIDVPKVEINNFEIVSQAVRHLIENGANRIVHITGSDRISVFRNRQQAYRHAIKEMGIEYSNTYMIDEDFTLEVGKSAAKSIFTEKTIPDAIICDSYMLMLGVVLQLKEMDISVPNDVKIICFGNNPSLEVITPSVSSIVQPITELAEASFNLLMKRIEEPDNKQFEQQIFSAKLINR